jgi:hypothetical protein
VSQYEGETSAIVEIVEYREEAPYRFAHSWIAVLRQNLG